MAPLSPKTLRNWLLFWGGCLLLGAAIVMLWMKRADDARADILARQAEALAGDRVALQAYWGEKAQWYPDPNALTALAITPRSLFNDFDATYVYFRGQRASLAMTLTQVGGYVNQSRINARKWPATLIERPLTPAERESLSEMIVLMDSRIAGMDTQSEKHGWNAHVLQFARDLLAANGGDSPTTAPLRQTDGGG